MAEKTEFLSKSWIIGFDSEILSTFLGKLGDIHDNIGCINLLSVVVGWWIRKKKGMSSRGYLDCDDTLILHDTS